MRSGITSWSIGIGTVVAALLLCALPAIAKNKQIKIAKSEVILLADTIGGKPIGCFKQADSANIGVVKKFLVKRGVEYYVLAPIEDAAGKGKKKKKKKKKKKRVKTKKRVAAGTELSPDQALAACRAALEGDPSSASPYHFLVKPFAGSPTVSNFFDHNLPFEFDDTNGFQLLHSGETSALGIDGHEGHDFRMPEGTELYAAAAGTVIFAGDETPFFCPPLNRSVSGKAVRIRHSGINNEVFDTVYGHLSTLEVSAGDVVEAGQLIGLSGNTGCSTGPHLHFHLDRRSNTNNGKPARIDPFGWGGSGEDPWASHPEGTQSLYLWKDPPALFRRTTLAKNPGQGNNAPIAITEFQIMGVNDAAYPNNEYITIEIDTRFASSSSLSLEGYFIRNNAGDTYSFPAGASVSEANPITLHSGSGTNDGKNYYWGRSAGVWNNDGDCAQLLRPNGVRMYGFGYSAACTSPHINAVADDVVVQSADLLCLTQE